MSLIALILAAIPAWLFRRNLSAYQPPPAPTGGASLPRVSVLIPARNEEQTIQAAVAAALASAGVELEVVVLDDQSEDETATIVRRLAECDDRVRLIDGPELPDGWCGKQHACWVLAHGASYDLLLFQDADVRLAPEGLARLVDFLNESGADLASGIPFQETGTLLEAAGDSLDPFRALGLLAAAADAQPPGPRLWGRLRATLPRPAVKLQGSGRACRDPQHVARRHQTAPRVPCSGVDDGPMRRDGCGPMPNVPRRRRSCGTGLRKTPARASARQT